MGRDLSTIQTLETAGGAAAAGEIEVPGLTVLGHPDAARVGDRAFLVDLRARHGAVTLSRQAPDFVPPGLDASRPLGLPHLSRTPIALTRVADDALLIDASATSTRLTVDGQPVTTTASVPWADLAGGVVLELAGRITLLLSLLARPRPARLDALGMIGLSAPLERVRDAVRKVADTDVPVLVRGESGSGKELVARALHDTSGRRQRPFVAVNLGALPPTLVASQLFGHERGAFSGADRRHQGLFVQAHGGTLFLDEIGEASPEVQVMLLRAIETGEIVPLGAERPQPVDVRLVAATDLDLDGAIRDGGFRAPLYHRLAGFVIALPPLRARRADIGPLLYAFLREELDALGDGEHLARVGDWLPSALVRRLVRYDWPGNVRELRNAARQIAIASRGEPRATLGEHLERTLAEVDPPEPTRPRDRRPAEPQPRPPRGAPQARGLDLDDDALLEALRRHRFEIAPTAAALGVPRPTLYDRIARSPRIRAAGDLTPDEIDRAIAEVGADLGALAAHLEVGQRGLLLRMRELGRR